MADRFVILGLAPARAAWFRTVAQWANSASIPVEFVKCVSPEELRARIASGRPHSAVLVDGASSGLDRDLVDVAHSAGCAVVAVDDRKVRRDWAPLGVDDVLPDFFDRKALLDSLSLHARRVDRSDRVPGHAPPAATPAWRGRVAMVCGPGGTGASTVAIALAQGLADDPRNGGLVALADLALHAEQAMLHDAGDVVPGVQELVEAFAIASPGPTEVRALTFTIAERGYSLLLGLRRASAWSALRPRAVEAAFDGLLGAFTTVVCDTDAELEGEDDGGSADVEERHVLARTTARRADVAFAVGLPGLKGLHALARVITDLQAAGVPGERIVPVVNRAPTRPRPRAELTAARAARTDARSPTASPVFLREAKVDEALRDGVRLLAQLTTPLTGAFHAVLDGAPALAHDAPEPQRIRPGSLGRWADLDDDASDDTGDDTGATAVR